MRDRANIRTDLWADEDWRKLSMGAQHLYMLILSHPTLNYAGVADWRPGRLAPLTSGITKSDIEQYAQELRGANFIYCDDDTEEVLVRSFLRHDGVIKHPRLHVSMANDYAGISSNEIREYLAFEVQKLHSEQPELALWKDKRVQTILKATAKNMKEVSQTPAKAEPSVLAKPLAKDLNSDSMLTATATATSSKEDDEAPRKRATRIPEDFTVNDMMRQWAAKKAPDVDIELATEKFINYWSAKSGKDATKRDWIATWRNWLLSDQERHSNRAPAQQDIPHVWR